MELVNVKHRMFEEKNATVTEETKFNSLYVGDEGLPCCFYLML